MSCEANKDYGFVPDLNGKFEAPAGNFSRRALRRMKRVFQSGAEYLPVEKAKPRFHPKTVIPEVPKGMELVKFHKEPALIPAREEGDKMFGKSQFSVRQFQALMELESRRRVTIKAEISVRPLF